MITKTENCLYCGEKMESKTAKKKFCSDLHRVYYNREKFRGTIGLIPSLIKSHPIEYKPGKLSLKDFLELQTVLLEEKNPHVDVEEIKRQIEAIKVEKLPPERNTSLGKKSWEFDRQKRILELEKQL